MQSFEKVFATVYLRNGVRLAVKRKRIELSDQQVFEQYIQNENNSTYNFTNMFIWAGDGFITYGLTEGCLVLFFQGKKQPLSASYPVGKGDKRAAVLSVSSFLEKQGFRPVFRNLSDYMVQELEVMFPGCFEFVEDRNTADYIYETEKMITLSGKKLHAKRNHFNYFKNNYSYEYKTLTQADMPACMSLFDAWVAEKGGEEDMTASRNAAVKLLEHFDDLPVRGGGIYLDGKLSAFSIGEPVSEDTALIHVEFALDYRGLFNVINSEFCAHEWTNFKYVNREEDMGLPGLRQTKLAYRPAYLLEKFNAVQVKPL